MTADQIDEEGLKNISLYQARLRWELDNYPQGTLEQFRSDPEELHRAIVEVVKSAIATKINAEQGGASPEVAQELAMSVVAPSDGPALMDDEPPEPLSDEDHMAILDWAIPE
ncbi:MAG: hypothetical protein KKB20_29180 [Proteobacteria bacterium]|nr:hypothetical protein [Pseudomonadota bacterium]